MGLVYGSPLGCHLEGGLVNGLGLVEHGGLGLGVVWVLMSRARTVNRSAGRVEALSRLPDYVPRALCCGPKLEYGVG